MSFLRSRKTSVVIFACLAFISLLAFQNCSQSVRLLGSSTPAQATNLNDMIRETEKEIKVTKAVMRGASRREVYEIRRVATYNNSQDKKNLQIKLKSKKVKKNSKSSLQAKNFKADRKNEILVSKNKKNLKPQQSKNLKQSQNRNQAYGHKQAQANKRSRNQARKNTKTHVVAKNNLKKIKPKKDSHVTQKASLKKQKAQGITKKKSKSPKPKVVAKNERKEIK